METGDDMATDAKTISIHVYGQHHTMAGREVPQFELEQLDADSWEGGHLIDPEYDSFVGTYGDLLAVARNLQKHGNSQYARRCAWLIREELAIHAAGTWVESLSVADLLSDYDDLASAAEDVAYLNGVTVEDAAVIVRDLIERHVAECQRFLA